MKIATFNANSIRSRLPILLDWLAEQTAGGPLLRRVGLRHN